MEDSTENVYSYINDTNMQANQLPAEPLPMSYINVAQHKNIPSPQALNVFNQSSSQGRRQKFFSGTQVVLMIAVAVFATLSIVFMTLYFTKEAKDKPCNYQSIPLDCKPLDHKNCSQNVCQNCSLVNNCKNESKNFTDDKQCLHVVYINKTIIQKCNDTVPKSCSDLYKNGKRKDGVYTINPDGLGAFNIRCDMTTSGGGWTVFQRRLDGSVDFYLGWNEYKKGFGNLTGEFWLGLDNIHRLTKSGQNVLRVDLEDFQNEKRYAQYSTFAVANEIEQYKLTIRGYSGNAGDSLTYHNGMKFSTKDVDNELDSTKSCAMAYKGAWWYNACHYSNLNGLYLRGSHTSLADGVNWYHWKGYYYSLKKTEMKIRPRSF